MRVFLAVFLGQRDRWILWTPVPLAAGIGAYFSLTFEPRGYVGVAALAALVLAALPFRRNGLFLRVWLVFFLAALGFSAAQFRAWHVAAPAVHKKQAAVFVQGRVIAAEVMEKAVRVTLDDLDPLPGRTTPERARLRLKPNDSARPEEGDVLRVKAVLQPLPVPVLPGAYDFQRAAWFKRLGATGYAVSDAETVSRRDGGYFFENLRRAMRDKVYAAETGAPANVKGLIVAFMTGDTGGITAQDWDVARESGIAHLIAISGSHFVMIVGVVFFLVRGALAAFPHAALRWPVKKIAAAAGIATAVFYVLLIGAPVSAQRAALMSSLIMLAVMIGRDPFTLRVAAFAAFVMLLATPEALVGAGFQMSFAAVVGLIAFYESTADRWRVLYREGGVLRQAGLFLAGCLLTTVVASVAVMPFSFFHFLRESAVAGLATNMVAVPVSSFVTFPLALLAGALMPFGLETWPLWASEKSIAFIMRVAEKVVAWPRASVSVDAWPVAGLVAIALGGMWICLWRGRLRWLGILPILLSIVFIQERPRPDALVGGRFRLLAAVRDEAGVLWISPGRADGFIRKAWEEREGGVGLRQWPKEGAAGPVSCSPRACVYRRIVFVKDGTGATQEDCNAAIVVTPEAEKPAFPCAARVIDKWQLYRKGTHMIFLPADGPVTIRTVHDARGDRPWVWPKGRYVPRAQ